jgi:hypothetical protein
MKTFKDALGRDWSVHANVTTVLAARDFTKRDPLDLDTISQLLDDLPELCRMIYAFCKGQNEGKSFDDFGAAMYGDVIDDARRAFMEEWADFFPKGQREVIGRMVAKWLASKSGNTSGDAPASSESTPVPSLSVSST